MIVSFLLPNIGDGATETDADPSDGGGLLVLRNLMANGLLLFEDATADDALLSPLLFFKVVAVVDQRRSLPESCMARGDDDDVMVVDLNDANDAV